MRNVIALLTFLVLICGCRGRGMEPRSNRWHADYRRHCSNQMGILGLKFARKTKAIE